MTSARAVVRDRVGALLRRVAAPTTEPGDGRGGAEEAGTGRTDDGTPDDGTPDDGTPDDGAPHDGAPHDLPDFTSDDQLFDFIKQQLS